MCRMIAAIGSGIPARALLLKLRVLAKTGKTRGGATSRSDTATTGHRDGWGIAELSDDTIYWKRNTLSADEDPSYDKAIEGVSDPFDGVLLGHLRKASPRTQKIVGNNHPFVKKDLVKGTQRDNERQTLAFMHNGSIRGCGDDVRCDSRAFFEDKVDATLAPEEALITGLASVPAANVNASGSVTSVMANSKELVALRKYRDEKHKDYYTLWHCIIKTHGTAKKGNYVLVAQERECLKDVVPDAQWHEIKNNEYIVVKNEKGTLTIETKPYPR